MCVGGWGGEEWDITAPIANESRLLRLPTPAHPHTPTHSQLHEERQRLADAARRSQHRHIEPGRTGRARRGHAGRLHENRGPRARCERRKCDCMQRLHAGHGMGPSQPSETSSHARGPGVGPQVPLPSGRANRPRPSRTPMGHSGTCPVITPPQRLFPPNPPPPRMTMHKINRPRISASNDTAPLVLASLPATACSNHYLSRRGEVSGETCHAIHVILRSSTQ